MANPLYLIGYRDDNRRLKYYHGMNGQLGRAATGSKKEAPRVDKAMAETILRQLPSLDNRGWQMAEDKDRCVFA